MNIVARVCIPTFNNERTIVQVVTDCLTQTSLPLVVIDDGSDFDVKAKLENSNLQVISEAFLHNRIEVIRHTANEGKGQAIQNAFVDSIKKGFTHLLTIDGDGQHPASEITNLVEAAQKYPWNVIVGKRKLGDANVPTATKFGRKFSNFWLTYQTGHQICDSQSGFRIYPLFHVQTMNFFTVRFDFEIEVLIRLLWRNVKISEVEVETFYPPPHERVTHFNKLWDNVRISLLNTVFVIISMCRGGLSRSAIAKALGIGIFVGCSPFFGFHSFIVVLIALIFRFNVILLWVGTQISVPPMIPFLIFSSLSIGHRLMGKPFITDFAHINLSAAYQEFTMYFMGATVVGAVLGLAGALLCFLILSKIPRNKTWTGKTRGGRFGNWFLRQVLLRLGLNAAYFCLYFIVPYFYLFAPTATKSSLQFWRAVSPNMGFWRLRFQVLRHYFRFGTLLLDRIYQSYHKDFKFTLHESGLNNITDLVSENKGALLLGAHIGGWALATEYIQKKGISRQFNVLKFAAETKKMPAEESTAKQVFVNLETLPIFSVREELERGKQVGLMADRPISDNYELVPFFDKLIPLDTTPYRIAALLGVPIVCFFSFKEANNSYSFFSTAAKTYAFTESRQRNEQLREWLNEYATILQNAVKRHPEQWLNFYPIWSTVPNKMI